MDVSFSSLGMCVLVFFRKLRPSSDLHGSLYSSVFSQILSPVSLVGSTISDAQFYLLNSGRASVSDRFLLLAPLPKIPVLVVTWGQLWGSPHVFPASQKSTSLYCLMYGILKTAVSYILSGLFISRGTINLVPLNSSCSEMDVVDDLFLEKICRATMHALWDNETLGTDDQWCFNGHWLEL